MLPGAIQSMTALSVKSKNCRKHRARERTDGLAESVDIIKAPSAAGSRRRGLPRNELTVNNRSRGRRSARAQSAARYLLREVIGFGRLAEFERFVTEA